MTLLYIDDDEDDHKFFTDALSAVNDSMICVGARDGKEGLKILKSLMPDYIFLDVNMPEMDGREVLKKVRSNSRFAQVPIVIFSTSLTAGDIEQFRRAGANECIIKPSSFTTLCNTLRTFFATRALSVSAA